MRSRGREIQGVAVAEFGLLRRPVETFGVFEGTTPAPCTCPTLRSPPLPLCSSRSRPTLSSAARLLVGSTVQRCRDIGSPRSSGSTSASSAGRRPGSRSTTFFRPPPGLRTRSEGSSPASNPTRPLRTAVSLTWATRATARIPPCPRIPAPAPSAAAGGPHADAGTTSRTSQRVGHGPPRRRSYHHNEPHHGRQHLDSLRALRVQQLASTQAGTHQSPQQTRSASYA